MNKTKFQRILCVIVSCVLAFSVLTLPVSADTSMTNNTSHFISRTKSNYEDYRSGKISFSDFLAAVTVDMGRYGMVAGAELTGIPDILDFLKSLGIDVDNPWEEYYFQHMGGGGSGGNRDEIMQGYGAVCMHYENGVLYKTIYGAYGIIFINQTNQIVVYTDSNYSGSVKYASDSYSTAFSGSKVVGYLNDSTSNSYTFYGDWRYDDGSSADDYISDIPEEPTPGYDDPSIPEDELEDFLEDLLNQLSLQFPDLSTIEGLLAALLAEMKTLDHDDDAAALSAVHSAIENLSSVGSSGNSEDVEKIISAINNTQFDYDKLVQCLTDLIGLNGDYSEISKLEIVKDKFSQKIGFVSSFADLCGKVITAYTKTSPSVSFDISLYGYSHTVSFDWLEQYMPTFRIMLCAFIYISYAWRTYRKVPEYIAGGGEDT